MKQRCTILDDYQGAGLSAMNAQGFSECVTLGNFSKHIADKQELARQLAGVSIVVAIRERTQFDRELLELLPDLRLLITLGMANASIDMEAARTCGVTVCGTRGRGNPTVEMTWALILSLVRKVPEEVAAFRDGSAWQQTIGGDLHNKTLGLIGLGHVGAGVARVGLAFGMNVCAYTPSLNDKRAADVGVHRAETIQQLLREADIVSLHVKLNAKTHGLIDAKALSQMRRSAVLINTSRGPVIDENALVKALESGEIAGAALDVFDVEPVPLDHRFRKLDNLLATPHLGYVTMNNYHSHFADVDENIKAWLDGEPVRVLES